MKRRNGSESATPESVKPVIIWKKAVCLRKTSHNFPESVIRWRNDFITKKYSWFKYLNPPHPNKSWFYVWYQISWLVNMEKKKRFSIWENRLRKTVAVWKRAKHWNAFLIKISQFFSATVVKWFTKLHTTNKSTCYILYV